MDDIFVTNAERVYEFHKTFGLPHPDKFTTLSDEVLALRGKLIVEEFEELSEELVDCPVEKQSPEKIGKELADLLYVIYGLAVTLGLDIDGIFEEVHKSNMSKLTKDGQVLRREDGKVIKSDQYKEPDLSRFFK